MTGATRQLFRPPTYTESSPDVIIVRPLRDISQEALRDTFGELDVGALVDVPWDSLRALELLGPAKPSFDVISQIMASVTADKLQGVIAACHNVNKTLAAAAHHAVWEQERHICPDLPLRPPSGTKPTWTRKFGVNGEVSYGWRAGNRGQICVWRPSAGGLYHAHTKQYFH